MSKQSFRKQTLKVTNNSPRVKLLCVEPIGEQVYMQQGKCYEVRIVGGDEGPMELFMEEDKIILYGWNNSDSAVYVDNIRIVGMEPHEINSLSGTAKNPAAKEKQDLGDSLGLTKQDGRVSGCCSETP